MTSVANAINIAGTANALATRLISMGLTDTSVATAVYYSDLRLQSLYGISGTVLPCFGSDVTGRTQTVTVNDQSSSHANITFGVPQGSVLCRVVFILDVIMCHLFFKLFARYRSKPEQITNCQLSVTISPLAHPQPNVLTFSLCTGLQDTRLLLQADELFAPPC